MLVLALILAQAAASAPGPVPTPRTTALPRPAATARPAPALGRSSEPARAKTLSEHAAEMKARGGGTKKVSFDDVRTVEPDEVDSPEETAPATATSRGRAKRGGAAGGPDGPDASAEEAAAAAQKRMDRAVERGLAVPERCSSSRRDQARREWDQAADACRRTPGCIPRYRDDASFGEKPLKTDHELIDDIRKRGFSEPHPLPK